MADIGRKANTSRQLPSQLLPQNLLPQPHLYVTPFHLLYFPKKTLLLKILQDYYRRHYYNHHSFHDGKLPIRLGLYDLQC